MPEAPDEDEIARLARGIVHDFGEALELLAEHDTQDTGQVGKPEGKHARS